MALDEIVKSIHAELYSRAVSPLMGSFIIAWCGWNYKLLLIIFSNLSVAEKFEVIGILYPNVHDAYWPILILPLVTALLFIFFYPVFAIPIFEYAKKNQKRMSDLKKQIEGDALLTREESRNILSQLDNMQEEYDKIIARKNADIDRLKIEIQNANLKNPPPAPEASKTPDRNEEKLPKTHVQVLKAVGINGKYESDVLAGFQDQIEAKYVVNLLVGNGYLKRSPRAVLTLTPKGVAYLAQNKD